MPQPRKSSSSGSGRSGSGRSGSSGRSSSARSSSSGARSRASSRGTAARKNGTGAAASRKGAAASRKSTAARGSAKRAADRTPASAKSDPAGVEQGLEALLQALTARASESLNLVLLTRDRMQEAFDDAVHRGHMTQQTANSLTTDLVRRTRREAKDIIADIEQLVGRGRTGLEEAGRRVRTAPTTDRALREMDRARRVVGVGPTFPILGYDDLTAAQISHRLDDLTPAQLRKVRDYERRHGNRKSVLAAVERKLA
jgi:polyhydroxyalkanoate synthesis regulator phasin